MSENAAAPAPSAPAPTPSNGASSPTTPSPTKTEPTEAQGTETTGTEAQEAQPEKPAAPRWRRAKEDGTEEEKSLDEIIKEYRHKKKYADGTEEELGFEDIDRRLEHRRFMDARVREAHQARQEAQSLVEFLKKDPATLVRRALGYKPGMAGEEWEAHKQKAIAVARAIAAPYLSEMVGEDGNALTQEQQELARYRREAEELRREKEEREKWETEQRQKQEEEERLTRAAPLIDKRMNDALTGAGLTPNAYLIRRLGYERRVSLDESQRTGVPAYTYAELAQMIADEIRPVIDEAAKKRMEADVEKVRQNPMRQLSTPTTQGTQQEEESRGYETPDEFRERLNRKWG